MANVCLLLEGTYPYVSGGVSGCVHQLIQMLPRTTFTLVYFGTQSNDFMQLRYKLPSNVVGLQEIFLFDELDADTNREKNLKLKELKALDTLHEYLHASFELDALPSQINRERLSQALSILFPLTGKGSHLFQSLASYGIWKQLLKEYCQIGAQIPFINFFYTWRSAHIPIYRILSHSYPKAEIYHSLCTGYAGLAGARAALQYEAPYFVTEHGIYAHERAIEIAEADWLVTSDAGSSDNANSAIKRWWIDMFRNLSRIAYHYADEIITLYEGNRRRQLKDGAPAHKTRIIPNGISLKFKEIRRKNRSWVGPKSQEKFKLGFVGRVVPIKDVKMLIKAIRAVVDTYPNIECQIIGPTDEDELYFDQCKELVKVLELNKHIVFTGKKNVAEVYPTLDCLLLTSISEAQPLVVLEANCAGVPVVSTRVGCCDELLGGASEADKMLGESGIVTDIGDPDGIAQGVLKIIHEPKLWERMSLAGIKRVTNFYEEQDLISRYDVLYRENLSGRSLRSK